MNVQVQKGEEHNDAEDACPHPIIGRHSGVIRKLLKERGQTCGLSPKLKPHEAGSECCPRRKEDISLYVSNTVNSSADVESSYPEGNQRVYYVQL